MPIFFDTRQGYEPIEPPTQQILIFDEDNNDSSRITGYKASCCRSLLYYKVISMFCFIPALLSIWYPKLKRWKYEKCYLKDAEVLLIEDKHGNCNYVPVETALIRLPDIENQVFKCFHYKHTKFVWIQNEERFRKIDEIAKQKTVDEYLDDMEGLFDIDYIDLLKFYGPNKIEIEVRSYWRLFIDEVFNPFYVFQAFSMLLWCFDNYLIYAACVFILTLFSVVTTLLQTRKQSESLRDLVESSKCDNVCVSRRNLLTDSITEDICATELVPGDLIILPKSDFILPCDAVLLTGECIVNESVLTGESVPVIKTALHSSEEIYSSNTHKRHTLFSGTSMIQSRYYGGKDVLARVVRTGFETTKGSLVKSILFPTPVGLQFYKDSLKFVFVLFIIAATGISYSLYLYITRNAPLKEIIIRSLDIITIVVPPALPAAMTVGIVYSQNRLKKLGIFCISSPRINVCGKVKLTCFDKTGTLTHDGLDTHFVIPCRNSSFSAPTTNCDIFDGKEKFVQAMATCHSLKQVDGKLIGDPLDLSIFEFTKWVLIEPGEDENSRYDMLAPTVVQPSLYNNDSQFPYQIGIIRDFPFSSNTQCMSVICRELGSRNMIAFTKGAPEKVATMCLPETLPPDFITHLSKYAAKGYRIIAIAYKELSEKFKWKEAQKVKRDFIECELTFLGLILMQNLLKDETTPIIKILQNASIRTVMITGDNILTAISVARDCEMVKPQEEIYVLRAEETDSDVIPKIILENIGNTTEGDLDMVLTTLDLTHCHFAIDGKTWTTLRHFYPDLLLVILLRTVVFARFQPEQKTQLITCFQSLDYVVSMVGDGANDCGALKAAHVGVSLSQTEASVAAPFTSSIPNISCIVHLLLEGRCALVTSFAVFKYMALYSLIQFFTILILYKHHSILGDSQFLFIDLIITTVLAVTIGLQGPAHKLGQKRPGGSLVALCTLLPLITQIILCGSIQLAALFYLQHQEWYEPIPDDVDDEVVVCWENTVLFTVSCFQYIIMAFVYSKGRPFRQMLITNFWFLISALSLTILDVYLLIDPTKRVAEFFEIFYLPHWDHNQKSFKYKLLLLPMAHFIGAVFIENCIADTKWFKTFLRFMTCKLVPKNKYKLLLDNHESLNSKLSNLYNSNSAISL